MNNKFKISALALATTVALGVAVTASAGTVGNANGTSHRMGIRATHMNGVAGTVASISGDTITVTGMLRPNATGTAPTYTVDATNAKIEKSGAASTVSAIAVGDKIVARGTVNGTNVTATNIADGLPTRDQHVQTTGRHIGGVSGTIAAISGNTVTVTGSVRPNTTTTAPTYTIDVTNAKIEKNGAVSTASTLAVGDKVVVRGTVNGTNVTATDVHDGMPNLSTHKTTGKIVHKAIAHRSTKKLAK